MWKAVVMVRSPSSHRSWAAEEVVICVVAVDEVGMVGASTWTLVAVGAGLAQTRLMCWSEVLEVVRHVVAK